MVIMYITNDSPKKPWSTPQLVVHGDVAEITQEGQLPPKEFGPSDGAISSAQDVHWIS